jgi:hypothetical protein
MLRGLLLKGYTVVRKSRTTEGVDWWLSKEGDKLFQHAARLEVSGINNGRDKIEGRVKEKLNQTKQSDASCLPAYVVVVEFSTPQAKMVRR